jgi:hypothetical protein
VTWCAPRGKGHLAAPFVAVPSTCPTGGIAESFASGMVTFKGMTITNGFGSSSSFGGGIRNLGTLSMDNSTFSEFRATFGGGIRNSGAMTLTHGTFENNTPDECASSCCP